MPPEIQAFIQATGRLPNDELDLQSFLASRGGGGFGGGGFGGDQFGGLPSVPFGVDPSTQAPPQFPLNFAATSDERGFRTGGPPPDFNFQPFPSALDRRGFGLPGGPGGPPSPELGAPAGVPAGPTAASQQQAQAPPPEETGALAALAPVFGNVAGGVARARLGGGADGFSFTQGPTAGPIGGANIGGLPGVGPTGSGDVLLELGRQQQADVANQQQVAAAALGSLLGGGGQIGGALASRRGQPATQPKRITVGNPANREEPVGFHRSRRTL